MRPLRGVLAMMNRGEACTAARSRWPRRGAWARFDVRYRGRVWPCAVGVCENRDPVRSAHVRDYVLGVGDTFEAAFLDAERRQV